MRIAHLYAALVFWSVACGQGFNMHYDLLQMGRAQSSRGIEFGPNGGFVVFIASNDQDSISPDSAIFYATVSTMGIDPVGTLLWENRRVLPGHGIYPGWANCCDSVPGGGFVVGGGSQSFDGLVEVYLMRLAANGDTLFTRSFGGANEQWIGRQVKRLENGDFVIVGQVGYDANFTTDGFIIRTDSSGNELWRQTYGWSSVLWDGLNEIQSGAGGDFYVSGSRFLDDVNGQHWLQRVDFNGTLKWRVSWGSPFAEGPTWVIECHDGLPLISSATGYDADQYMRPYLAKLDSADGSIIWEHEYGEIGYQHVFMVAKEGIDYSINLCGYGRHSAHQHGLLVKTTSEGDSLWMRWYVHMDTATGDVRGQFYDLLPLPDGGIIAVGERYGPLAIPGDAKDTWVVRVDSFGCIIPGCQLLDGITEQVTNLSAAVIVFPNPASSEVTVSIALPSKHNGEELTLTVVSTQGQHVARQKVRIGENTLVVHGYSPGVYYLHLSTAGTWLSGTKLIIE